MVHVLLTAAAAALSRWGPSPDSTQIVLRFGLHLPAHGLTLLKERFFAVSDPTNPQWSAHLTRDEADDMVRPPLESSHAVVSWLASSCATNVTLSRGGEWVRAISSAACARSLLGVPVVAWADADGKIVAHTLDGDALLPKDVESFVAVVLPGKRPRSASSRVVAAPVSGSGAAPAATPAVIRAAYGMGDVQATGAAENRLLITGFDGEYAENADLQQFFRTYFPAGVGRTFSKVGNVGPTGTGEASLDVQYGMSIGANVSTTFWYTDTPPGPNPYDNEPYLSWLTALTALPDDELPNTCSTSYSDNEDTIAPAYLIAVEALMLKLGSRGTSMLHASGDGGVEGTQKGVEPCVNGRFHPTWPASSPYITSVGATDNAFTAGADFSSGGFSDVTPAPAYQLKAIAAFKASAAKAGTLPPGNLWNSTGRGIPDVSAVGVDFPIIVNGGTMSVAGTSCSTPTFAGVVALLNDARVAAGKRPLGFLNQILYGNPNLFTDITQGFNPGCGSPGFPAVQGWDPVTGVGSPQWAPLLSYVKSLP